MMNEKLKQTKKMVIELDQRTFAMLEVLAFGLHRQDPDLYKEKHDKKNDDFAPMVKDLLVDVANSLAAGVTRPGAWERSVIESLTNWDGTVEPTMSDPCIREELAACLEKYN